MARRVNIAGHDYKVHVVKDVAETARSLGYGEVKRKEKLMGFCAFSRKIIVLDAGLSPKALASTFLHEAIHATAPELGEPIVLRLEDAIGRILWRQGWRPDL